MTHAVVVGSGPNGLAGAVALAEAGLTVRVLEAADRIGGGTRSSEHHVPGVIHDDCSAFHPTGAASPFFRQLGLDEHGLRWSWPEIELAHPLDGGRAGVLWRDIDRTAEHMDADGDSWRNLIGKIAARFDDLTDDVFRPILHIPKHPLVLAHFGLNALLPASTTVRRWQTDETRALFGGIAAHAFSSLRAPLSSSVGLMLGAAGHAYGWPVAQGGSQAITDALARKLTALGGAIETNVEFTSLDDLNGTSAPDVVLLSVSPRAADRLLGERLPRRVARAYRRYQYGPAAYKVDFSIEGDVPWTNELVRRAGTVHLGGTFEETVAAEGQIVRGTMPARPFVLVGQQYLADPTRSADGINPIWTYAHVPNGHATDVVEPVIDRIESYAPGFRSRIRHVTTRSPAEFESYNANYIGGDIGVGRNGGRQIAIRPRLAINPYDTGVPGVFLCSSATPPGAGVHGMCGFNAANAALRYLSSR